MVAIRTLDRYAPMPGTVPWITPTNIPNGQMCTIGDGQYAVCSSRGVEIMEVTAKAAAKTTNLVSYTGGATGDGLPKGIEYNRKGKIMLVVEIQEGAPPVLNMKLRQIDLGSGTLDWEHDFAACASAGPIAYNGIDWWLSYTSTAATNSARFLLLDIDGSTVTIKRNIAHTNFGTVGPALNIRFTDMAYDGVFLWALTSSFVSRWDVNQRLPPRNAWSGTADGSSCPGTTHQGITTQRQSHYLVLSRT
jgi:hypothetical protein